MGKAAVAVHGHSLALLTDLYQLTMAQGYWSQGLASKEAVFQLFFRRSPFQGGFTVAAGLEAVIEWLSELQVDSSDIEYLSGLLSPAGGPLLSGEFLEYLSKIRFSGHLDAVPEGTIIFPYEPLIRVQAPLIEAQLIESALLNLINFPSLIATKSARICIAAQGDPVLEFGLRRAQGIDGALTASRAAYIGGCCATSNVLAGKLFGIPVKGTHAHSWVMAYGDEISAFEHYAAAHPENIVFLVDTYDTLQGVRHAIAVGRELRAKGHRLLGIRLDSGDLADLSIRSRRLLDEAGFQETTIMASNELDEVIISELKRQGAKISVWGVGTHLVTSSNQPALDGVYKMSAIRDAKEEWQDTIKLSEQMTKVNHPGILQVRRYYSRGENFLDVLYDVRNGMPACAIAISADDQTHSTMIDPSWQSEELLIPIFRDGKLIYTPPSLEDVRKSTAENLSRFPIGVKRFLNPHLYRVQMEHSLYSKKIELVKNIRDSIKQAQGVIR